MSATAETAPKPPSEESNWSLEEIFEDIECRFIINAPDEDYESTNRIMFDIEAAQWFYIDHVVPKYNLPFMTLKQFTQKIFQHCPALREHKNVNEILTSWGLYKRQVPVRGAIMLNTEMDKIILVKNIGGTTWSFPGGKVNRNESDVSCAVREVMEETNYDLTASISEQSYLEAIVGQKPYKYFLATGISENHDFRPLTKGEIDLIQWFPLNDIPPFTELQRSKKAEKYFFIVERFGAKIRRWVQQKKQLQQKRGKTRKPKASTKVLSYSSPDNLPENGISIDFGKQNTFESPFSGFQFNRELLMEPFGGFLCD
ncbi:uncharacterized protein LOC126318292 [Schistocerca gregaria]|uniref:uncharacterized protein LOC126318292 n=1 Tax=Schistocerca gregaria TaxID=7010 RepID=UPI00211DC107|nr:uncharacterized protein LOC126318292 [Schistocerca gregaria]